jgi:hypothetical protein
MVAAMTVAFPTEQRSLMSVPIRGRILSGMPQCVGFERG